MKRPSSREWKTRDSLPSFIVTTASATGLPHSSRIVPCAFVQASQPEVKSKKPKIRTDLEIGRICGVSYFNLHQVRLLSPDKSDYRTSSPKHLFVLHLCPKGFGIVLSMTYGHYPRRVFAAVQRRSGDCGGLYLQWRSKH